jgi:hypothetical protein
MTLGSGWLTKTQKRISDALVGGQLTKWEMQFIQTIDAKLETYKTDSKLSDNQHQKLFMLLTKAENTKTRNAQPAGPFRSPFELPNRFPFSTHAHESHDSDDPQDSDRNEQRSKFRDLADDDEDSARDEPFTAHHRSTTPKLASAIRDQASRPLKGLPHQHLPRKEVGPSSHDRHSSLKSGGSTRHRTPNPLLAVAWDIMKSTASSAEIRSAPEDAGSHFEETESSGGAPD